MGEKAELIVEGRKLPVSNLNKVLWPKTGFTKGQMIDYYIRIAPVLIPHLKDRPLTLKRYPNGVEQEFFYEKNRSGESIGCGWQMRATQCSQVSCPLRMRISTRRK